MVLTFIVVGRRTIDNADKLFNVTWLGRTSITRYLFVRDFVLAQFLFIRSDRAIRSTGGMQRMWLYSVESDSHLASLSCGGNGLVRFRPNAANINKLKRRQLRLVTDDSSVMPNIEPGRAAGHIFFHQVSCLARTLRAKPLLKQKSR